MTRALLIVGHGTRDEAGQAECAELVERVRALRPSLRTELGYLELCPPPIADSMDQLVADGIIDVTVVPLVLLAAGHAKGDVPAAVARARLEHPGVTFRYGRPLGIHSDVLEVAADRIRTAATPGQEDRTGVAVVGRGSSDPDANGDLVKIARMLWEGRSWHTVEPGFVSLAAPSVPATLQRLVTLGAEQLVLHSYFLFTGVLERRIRAQADAWADQHGVPLWHAGYLGPDDRIARLLLTRYDEAHAGDVRANCDTCLYRVTLPGFEDRVGQPQTLHHHPDDEHTHHHRDAPHSAQH